MDRIRKGNKNNRTKNPICSSKYTDRIRKENKNNRKAFANNEKFLITKIIFIIYGHF